MRCGCDFNWDIFQKNNKILVQVFQLCCVTNINIAAKFVSIIFSCFYKHWTLLPHISFWVFDFLKAFLWISLLSPILIIHTLNIQGTIINKYLSSKWILMSYHEFSFWVRNKFPVQIASISLIILLKKRNRNSLYNGCITQQQSILYYVCWKYLILF